MTQRPQEQEAVCTTIVGGRPPGSGTKVGNIPRGIEILVKKASVDPEFRELLLRERSRAAQAIDLDLQPAEAAMLDAIPVKQLEIIIERTTIPEEQKPAFLGKVAATMILALGLGLSSCGPQTGSLGIRPEDEQRMETHADDDNADDQDNPMPPTKGIRPDKPSPKK